MQHKYSQETTVIYKCNTALQVQGGGADDVLAALLELWEDPGDLSCVIRAEPQPSLTSGHLKITRIPLRTRKIITQTHLND